MSQKPVKLPEEKEFLDLADNLLGKALESDRQLEFLATAAQTFISMEEGSALGFAKILHGINFRWTEIDNPDRELFQAWAHRATGKSVATVQRSVCVWEWLDGDYIPAEYRDGIHGFSMKMLKRAYGVSLRHKKNKTTGQLNFIPSVYDLQPADWRMLSECVDEGMLIETLDKITKKEPNANRVNFSMNNDGYLWFQLGKNEPAIFGQLYVDSDDTLVQQGVAEFVQQKKLRESNGS